MKIIKIILGILLVLVIGFVILGLIAPKTYNIKRSILINAERTDIWDNLVKFKNNNKFSPWYELDTAAKYTFGGTDGEVGCTYKWEGNDKVGAGTQTRVSQKEPDEIVNKINFTKPMEDVSTSRFLLSDSAGATMVTWTLEGEQGFFSRAMMFLMGGMDKMIGPDYEKGLKKIKRSM